MERLTHDWKSRVCGFKPSTGRSQTCIQALLIPLDFRFWLWILKVLPVGSFSNLNVATIKQTGIKGISKTKLAKMLTEAPTHLTAHRLVGFELVSRLILCQGTRGHGDKGHGDTGTRGHGDTGRGQGTRGQGTRGQGDKGTRGQGRAVDGDSNLT